MSNQHYTYVFVPQDVLRDLFGVYGMDLPTQLAKPDLSQLDANDTIPSNVDPSRISYVGELLSAPSAFFVANPRTTVRSPDNGAGVSLHPSLASDTDQGWTTFETGGWTTIETVLLRLYTGYTPSGRFPMYLNNWGTGFRMGYDAAVCMHRYEPWIIETYNTSITPPSALWIIGKGDSGTLLSPSGKIRGAPISSTRYLNTTGKDAVFSVIRGNVVYQMGKTNDGGGNYVPSPTVRPIAPPCISCLFTSTCYRLNLLPTGLDPWDTPNSPQIGSPLSAQGSVRPTLYRILRGRHPSSHNCTQMKH